MGKISEILKPENKYEIDANSARELVKEYKKRRADREIKDIFDHIRENCETGFKSFTYLVGYNNINDVVDYFTQLGYNVSIYKETIDNYCGQIKISWED